jgi:hypothetical protein
MKMKYPGARAFYERFLKEAHASGAAVMRGSQITEWWQDRASVQWIHEEQAPEEHRWTLQAGRPLTEISLELTPPSGLHGD